MASELWVLKGFRVIRYRVQDGFKYVWVWGLYIEVV